jgi:hypothetical protein
VGERLRLNVTLFERLDLDSPTGAGHIPDAIVEQSLTPLEATQREDDRVAAALVEDVDKARDVPLDGDSDLDRNLPHPHHLIKSWAVRQEPDASENRSRPRRP